MIRTRIDKTPKNVPYEIERLISGAEIYDSSCSPEARVYFIDKHDGYYLKCASVGTLGREAEMTSYFHRKGLAAEVVAYVNDEYDWMLTRRVIGEDATHMDYIANPKRLAEFMGEELRRLQEIDYTGCPVMNKTAEYLALAEANYRTGNYDMSYFPDSFGYKSAEEAYKYLASRKHELECNTLVHGDYCLPNVMLNGWQLSAFIDLGNAGVSDRHIDLFWGAWTLEFNLKTDEYRDRFFDAYGRDRIDLSRLSIVAAAEVFG